MTELMPERMTGPCVLHNTPGDVPDAPGNGVTILDGGWLITWEDGRPDWLELDLGDTEIVSELDEDDEATGVYLGTGRYAAAADNARLAQAILTSCHVPGVVVTAASAGALAGELLTVVDQAVQSPGPGGGTAESIVAAVLTHLANREADRS